MAVTRLQRRVKRRRIKSIEASDYLQKITFTPVVKKIDVDEIKKKFLDSKDNVNRQKAIIISPNSKSNVIKNSKNDIKKNSDEKEKVIDKTLITKKLDSGSSNIKKKKDLNKPTKNTKSVKTI